MTWRRAGAIVALAGAVALVGSGCSWRAETDPVPFRTPSPVTVLRDNVAAAEAALAVASGAERSDRTAAEAAAIPVRLGALGGVSATSSPRPATDFDAALDAALAAAHECVAGAEDDPLGGLCSSIELSHWAIAAASGTTVQSLPAPEAGLTPHDTTAVDTATLARLALEHDRARALYEVIAARAVGSERTDSLARSAEHRERAVALLALPGVEDLTEVAYDVPATSVSTKVKRTKAALAAEIALADAYSALLINATPPDRPWLANAAVDAYVAASAHGLAPGDVPALPGVASGG